MADKCRRISQGAVGGVSLWVCLCTSSECALMIFRPLFTSAARQWQLLPALPVRQPATTQHSRNPEIRREAGGLQTSVHQSKLPYPEPTSWINSVGRCFSGLSRKQIKCSVVYYMCDLWRSFKCVYTLYKAVIHMWIIHIKHSYNKLILFGCVTLWGLYQTLT